MLLQFALNPQVLPFYPRSLLSDSCLLKAADSTISRDVYSDFAWSLEQFCGISDDTGRGSPVDDKFCDSRTDSWDSCDLRSDLSVSSREQSFDAVSNEILKLLWVSLVWFHLENIFNLLEMKKPKIHHHRHHCLFTPIFTGVNPGCELMWGGWGSWTPC